MTSYSTSQLDAIIAGLEDALATGYVEITLPDSRRMVYRSVADIRTAISYFTALYDNATDAPSTPVKKVRTFYCFGGKGIGF